MNVLQICNGLLKSIEIIKKTYVAHDTDNLNIKIGLQLQLQNQKSE